ncbi:MAG: dihydroneopterin aldolase [Candidatus Neomarinimicrobiota bacterium]
MDKISILKLKIPGNHGVYDFEKKTQGTFELDVELFLDLITPCNTDQLKDTVDYARVTETIIRVFNEKHCNLIERVGEKICKELLNQFPVEKVMIKIKKPHAPIEANFDTVEVQLIRLKNLNG